MAKFVRLGDLLMDQGFTEAALIEYKKAEDPEEPPSSTALSRMVVCYQKQSRFDMAHKTLERALGLYPENALVLRTAATYYSDDLTMALQYWQKAHEINPYNIETQQQLVALYTKDGNQLAAERHSDILTILYKGGAIIPQIQDTIE